MMDFYQSVALVCQVNRYEPAFTLRVMLDKDWFFIILTDTPDEAFMSLAGLYVMRASEELDPDDSLVTAEYLMGSAGAFFQAMQERLAVKDAELH